MMNLLLEFELDLEVFCLYPPTATPTTILPGVVTKVVVTAQSGLPQVDLYSIRDSGSMVHSFPSRRIFRSQAEAQEILDIINY